MHNSYIQIFPWSGTPAVNAKLLCTQGSLSTNWASLQQQHRLCMGFCLSPTMGKGPFVKKVKGNYPFTSMDTILSSILFYSLPCKNNPVFPLERAWNRSKSKRLYACPYESLPPAWGLSHKECVAVTAVHQPGWVVLRTLLSSVIGWLQQLWPENCTSLILLVYRILSILVLHRTSMLPELNISRIKPI